MNTTYPKLAISALVVVGTIGAAEGQLVDGQTIGIDFGDGIWTDGSPPLSDPAEKGSGSETNFAVLVQTRDAGGTISRVPGGVNVTGQAISTDITGAALTGVTFSTSGWAGFLGAGDQVGYNAAGVGNYTGTSFSDLSFNDGMFGGGTDVVTIAGLDDALEYELVIVSNMFANANFGATVTEPNSGATGAYTGTSIINGGTTSAPNPPLTPFTLTGLQTDGSGNLVIQFTNNPIIISALTVKAVTPVVVNDATWQTDANGNWSDSANWSPGVPNAVRAVATFDSTLPLTGPLTATLDAATILSELNFDSSESILIAGGNTLTLDSSGAAEVTASAGSHDISAAVSMSSPLNVDLASGTSLNVSGALSGARTVTNIGDGSLSLTGDLSGFTGGITASSGFVSTTALSAGTNGDIIAEGGNISIGAGSTATVSRLNSKNGADLSISGTVTLGDNASFGVGAGLQGTTGSVTVNTGGVLNVGAASGYTAIGGGDLAGETSQSGNGTLTIAGGTLNVAAPGAGNGGAGGLDASRLWMNPYGDGGVASTINLDGGLLSTQRSIQDGSAGTTIFNFNGGTLQAAAATVGPLLNNLDRVNFRDGGGTIDTQAFDITCNQAFLHSDIGGDSATDGGLTKIGSGTLTKGGTNTYTGNTSVDAGVLTLSAGGQLLFVPTTNGVNNQITGAGPGTLNLDGEIFLDLSGADTTAGNMWTIVDVANLTETYGGTFSVNSSLGAFTEAADVWTLDDGTNLWSFSEATGILSVGSASTAYDTWASVNGLDGTSGKENGKTDDPEGDGRNNLYEFGFDGDPLNNSDLGKVFLLTNDGADDRLILTIAVRSTLDAFTGSPSPSLTVDGITYTVEGSTDLNDFTAPVSAINSVTTGLPTPSAGYEYRSFSLDGSLNFPNKGFLRAEVAEAP